jgi:hypothetical protein
MKAKLVDYLNNDRHYWWTVAVFPGLYALLYLYKNNYTLVNSVEQLVGLAVQFIVFPVIGFLILDLIFKKFLATHRTKLYFSFLLISTSSFMSLMIFMGWRWKALLLLAVIVMAISFVIAKHYKKVVLLLGFMSLIAAGQLAYFYVVKIDSQKKWVKEMPFENITFTVKPNIYVIQPDGYVGKETLQKTPYSTSNEAFYNALHKNGFTFNHEYRSNYSSTLTSNAALFTGQQHYFNKNAGTKELLNARNVIVGSNPILRTFKNNGYELNLITETTYFYTNHPNSVYDTTNITENDLSYFPYFQQGIDVITPLKNQLKTQVSAPQFTFIEFLSPAHIAVTSSQSQGIATERTAYLDRLKSANGMILEMTELITRDDPDAIILLVADHGGFVGLHHTGEIYLNPTVDVAIKNSILSSLLAVKAPSDFTYHLNAVKSSVGVFPNLFAYLSQQQPVEMKDDGSYLQVSQGANKRVYRYFDSQGNEATEIIPMPPSCD